MATIGPESPFNRVFVGASSDIVDVVPKSNAEKARTSLLRSLRHTADEEINRRYWQNKFAEEDAAKNANECVTKAMGTQAPSAQTQTASTLAPESHNAVVCEEKTEIVPPAVSPDPPKVHQEPLSKAVPIPKENPARHSSTLKGNYPINVHFRNVMWISIAASLLFFVSLSVDKTREVLDNVSHAANALVGDIKAGADRPTSSIAKEEPLIGENGSLPPQKGQTVVTMHSMPRLDQGGKERITNAVHIQDEKLQVKTLQKGMITPVNKRVVLSVVRSYAPEISDYVPTYHEPIVTPVDE